MQRAKIGVASGVRYLPQLDGVRALAVLTIVAFHARSSWFPGGYIGVDLFFVMSGYLITGILWSEIERRGGVSYRRFYIRRALRLAPALFVFCAIVGLGFLLVPGVAQRSGTLLGVVGAFTYTSSILAASGHFDLGWMLHTWSLSVEEYFYLVWPFVLVWISRARRPLLIIGSMMLLAVGYRIGAGLFTDWTIQRISYAPDTRTEQLLLGATLAVLLPRLRFRVSTWLALLSGLLFAVFAILPAEVSGQIYRNGGSTLVALAAAILIANLVQHPTGWLSRLFSKAPLVWVGQRSYGIYLWNLPLVGLIAATPVPGPLQLPVKLLMTFLVPALSYRWIEQPFLALKQKFEPPPALADGQFEAGRGSGPLQQQGADS